MMPAQVTPDSAPSPAIGTLQRRRPQVSINRCLQALKASPDDAKMREELWRRVREYREQSCRFCVVRWFQAMWFRLRLLSVRDPADHVVVGDWDCDGTATAALVTGRDGHVHFFGRWAAGALQLEAPAAATGTAPSTSMAFSEVAMLRASS